MIVLYPLTLYSILYMCACVESQFEYCVDFIHQHQQVFSLPTVTEQLKIYGLFQQIVDGNVYTSAPTDKQSTDFTLWQAHYIHTGKSKQQCMTEYVELIKSVASRYNSNIHSDGMNEQDMIELYKILKLSYPSPQNLSNDQGIPLNESITTNTQHINELQGKLHNTDTNGVLHKAEQLAQHTQQSRHILNDLSNQAHQHNELVRNTTDQYNSKLNSIELMHQQLMGKLTENNIIFDDNKTQSYSDTHEQSDKSYIDTLSDVLSISIPVVLGVYALYNYISSRRLNTR